jgi:hypothetical protein
LSSLTNNQLSGVRLHNPNPAQRAIKPPNEEIGPRFQTIMQMRIYDRGESGPKYWNQDTRMFALYSVK